MQQPVYNAQHSFFLADDGGVSGTWADGKKITWSGRLMNSQYITLDLCASLKVTDQVSHPQKCKLVFLLTLRSQYCSAHFLSVTVCFKASGTGISLSFSITWITASGSYDNRLKNWWTFSWALCGHTISTSPRKYCSSEADNWISLTSCNNEKWVKYTTSIWYIPDSMVTLQNLSLICQLGISIKHKKKHAEMHTTI
jgi:hypothetical protein